MGAGFTGGSIAVESDAVVRDLFTESEWLKNWKMVPFAEKYKLLAASRLVVASVQSVIFTMSTNRLSA